MKTSKQIERKLKILEIEQNNWYDEQSEGKIKALKWVLEDST